MTYLQPLSTVLSNVGTKASGLLAAQRCGLQIPETFVLPETVYTKLLEKHTSVSLSDFPCPPELLSEFAALLVRFRRLAVRSSFRGEDGAHRCGAGRYRSVVDVRSTEQVWRAVLDVWASAVVLGDPVGAALVQPYVHGGLGGVAFAKHPLRPRSRVRLAEWSPLGVAAVARGAASVCRATWSSGSLPQGDDAPPALMSALEGALASLEQVLSDGVDIEWIWDGALWIVQARRVPGAIKISPTESPRWIEVDAYHPGCGIELRGVQELYERWSRKRLICRRRAARIGIPHSRAILFNYDRQSAAHDLEPALAEFQHDILEVTFDRDKLFTVRRPDVLPLLLRMFGGRTGTVLIQEFIPNDLCGHATLLPDGSFYIEYVRGGFRGFDSNEIIPSRMIVGSDGRVGEAHRVPQDRMYRFDLERGWHLAPVGATPELTRKQLDDIIALVDALRDLRPVRIEWLLWRGTVHAYDIAREKRDLALSTLDSVCISPGTAGGRAWILDDLSPLRSIYSRRVDVLPDASLQAARCSAAVRAFVGTRDRPIVVARCADPIVTLLMNHAAGYVFGQGALLCHAAITLREAGIPAVVWRGPIRDGDPIEIRDDGVFTSDGNAVGGACSLYT